MISVFDGKRIKGTVYFTETTWIFKDSRRTRNTDSARGARVCVRISIL